MQWIWSCSDSSRNNSSPNLFKFPLDKQKVFYCTISERWFTFQFIKEPPPMVRLENKVTVITGASSGIGAALALAFSQAGAPVALMARRKEKLEKVAAQCPGRTLVAAGDVTEARARRTLVEKNRSRLRSGGYPGQQRRNGRLRFLSRFHRGTMAEPVRGESYGPRFC